MAYRIRRYRYRTGGWEVDFTVKFPNGRRLRRRRKSPHQNKGETIEWAEQVHQEILDEKLQVLEEKEVPTVSEFAPEFIDGYARANRQKPSGIAAKEVILRLHLLPRLGDRRLDRISTSDVERLKGELSHLAPKTVNNVLCVFSRLLRVAVEWEFIEAMPCQIRLLRVRSPEAKFFGFEEYERLTTCAQGRGLRPHLLVLLGGDAGLRQGEMIGLRWEDVDLDRRQITIRHSVWRGHLTLPKGARLRRVPMTQRLCSALTKYRQPCNSWVLTTHGGNHLSQQQVWSALVGAQKAAQVPEYGVHVLRHTFCSHLAMRGAPVRSIQALAGHASLTTTQGYMHLSPEAVDGAIRLLDDRQFGGGGGGNLEKPWRNGAS